MPELDPSAAPPSPPLLSVVSPVDGSVLTEIPDMDDAGVRAVVRAAAEAQRAWGALPVRVRARRVAAFGEALVASADALVDLIVRETSKAPIEALAGEVSVAADHALYLGQHAELILADQEIRARVMKHRESYVRYVPMGVIGVISPWSSPIALPLASVFEALVAGNAAVVKPSELAPSAVLRAREIALESGLPEGLFEVVTGGPETARALVDSGVARVVFAGSTVAGRTIAAQCAERLIPCVMTLSGNAPLIACADCDVERTARAVVYGAFAHGGQHCASVERVYVHHRVHDPLLRRITELTRALRVGDPTRTEVDLGALVQPSRMAHLDALMRDAVARGAVVVAGGRRIETHGMYLEPTVLARCDHTMRVMREEVFGPMVAIASVQDDEEALTLANDSPLGLCGYVFSRDLSRAEALAERVSAGTVMVNDVLSAFGAVESPFGGIKASGNGWLHSDEALRAMCYARHISTEGTMPRVGERMWFPYRALGYKVARAAMRTLFGRHGVLGPIADLL